MKTFSIFALVFAFLSTLVPASGEEAKHLRVLCYNIHYGQGNDGVYDIERLARVINESQPDIVALQEVDVVVERSGKVHQARKLGELTGMAVRYGPTQHYQGGLYGNAILTKLPILDVLIHPLPYTEATPEKTTYPRAAIAVTMEGINGKPFRFISTHFQHNLEEDRIEQAKAINQLFADNIPTILAGDMNSVPGSDPVAILEEKWKHAGSEPLAPTAPSKEPRNRIDYIFYRPGESFRVVSENVIDEPMASDHCPVFAEFAFSEK
ncbi:MAG: endonuclease/exonuclease/phosphatase family protein [Verrucomicrobiales bacterium]|nr:endonuclease/exonuclease/phosphatase family protein [Verrucomicrobiales bacterium]